MSESPIPTGITADRTKETMTIAFSDGATFEYPFSLLRSACPCAQCRGGHENMKPEPDDDVFSIPLMDARATRLEDVKAIGNYAISIIWGDGHTHGIYNWHYLHVLGEKQKEADSR